MRGVTYKVVPEEDLPPVRCRRLDPGFVRALLEHRGEGVVAGPTFQDRYEAVLFSESIRAWLRKHYPDLRPRLYLSRAERGWQVAGRLEPREVR